jgi:hypothetical protein
VTQQADVYSIFIEAELRAERDRKTGMDARASSLVATSGGLVTILAAVGAFVGTDPRSQLPWPAFLLLLLALFAFAGAALAGIWSGRSRPYKVPSIEPMWSMIGDRWRDDEGMARKEVAKVHIEMIEKLRDVNKAKETWLRVGWSLQVVALVLLSAVVLIVLVRN